MAERYEIAIKFERGDKGGETEFRTVLNYPDDHEGMADAPFCFGNRVVEALKTLKDHFSAEEWQSFLLSLDQMRDE
jgi:hypothetical protein